MPHHEDPESDESRQVPSGENGREDRREGGESEAAAVHCLDAEMLCQTPAEDLWGESVEQLKD